MIGMKDPLIFPDEGLAFRAFPAISIVQENDIFIQQLGDKWAWLLWRALVADPVCFLLEWVFWKKNSLLVGAFRAKDTAGERSKLGGVLTALTITWSKKPCRFKEFESFHGSQKRIRSIVDGNFATFSDGNCSSNQHFAVYSESVFSIGHAGVIEKWSKRVDKL